MSARIVVRHLAKRDILTVSKSYEGHREGLGVSFLDMLNALLEHLRQYPESDAPVFQEVRAAMIDRFPYVVYYTYAKHVVRVIAVIHGSRDSEAWRSRL
jgi:plasmid stabilization system protein ParE